MTRYQQLAGVGVLALGLACAGDGGDDQPGGPGFAPGDDGDDTGDGDSQPDPADDGGDGGDGGGDDGGGDGGDDGGGDGDTGGGDDGSFIMEPDGGGADNQCDLWAQDCPDGEKCMPWANDGGNSWNATKCTGEADNPAEPGDECQVDGTDVSGIDNCKAGSMCFAVDPETNTGTCVPFCTGSPDAPTCDDPGRACNISNDGVLILCLETCDPILQDCPQGSHVGLGCYPVFDQFLCWSDYSWDNGAYGDPCEFFNVCDPGLFCSIPDFVPGCAGSIGCCTEFCDLDNPSAGAGCAGAADGQTCVPFFDEGMAPPGAEGVGACGVPT